MGRSTEISYSYDGTGQLNNDVFSSAGSQYTRQWYWDRGKSLYTLTSGGSPRPTLSYGADGIGYIPGGGRLTVTDVDLDGFIAEHHNVSGNSAWWASNPYHAECISGNPVPASQGYVDAGNPIPSDEDGGSNQSVTVSANGRAFLSRANGYTTPDFSSSTPYAGPSANSSRRALFVTCLHGQVPISDPMTGEVHCVTPPSPPITIITGGSSGNPFEGIDGNDPFGMRLQGLGGGGPKSPTKKKLPKCPTGTPSFINLDLSGGELGVFGPTASYNPRSGDLFGGPQGGIGVSGPWPVSGMLTGQFLHGSGHSPADVSSFQSGLVFTVQAGAGGGAQGMWSPFATHFPGNVSGGGGIAVPATASATVSYGFWLSNIGAICS